MTSSSSFEQQHEEDEEDKDKDTEEGIIIIKNHDDGGVDDICLAGGRITVSAGANMLGQHAQSENLKRRCTREFRRADGRAVAGSCSCNAGRWRRCTFENRVTSSHQGYAFVEMKRDEDATTRSRY